MAPLDSLQFRLATPSDATNVAALHADSWRRHYRHAYSNEFLDGDVVADRLAVWSDRLREPSTGRCTILAEDGARLVGFAHTVFEEDPTWGALLDNLHVVYDEKRRGVGTRLLARTALALICQDYTVGLHLWVLERNTAAQAIYGARGGKCVGSRHISPPGGVAGRMNGSPVALRYGWGDPSALLAWC